jgi:ribosomal protein S18 acetylase RimI-like enzyme
MPEIVLPLTVRDATAEDRAGCAWAGSGAVSSVDRALRGEFDYLVVCPPAGLPVAMGGINYTESPGAGTLFQLSVHATLRSCGIGTLLIYAMEDRIRERGLPRAELGVDEQVPRPQALYERLGYAAYGRRPASWDQDGPDGSTVRYETTITLLRKDLS